VLLVILIFLVLNTTYTKYTELPINLPTANAKQAQSRPQEIVVTVTPDGRYLVNQQFMEGRSVELLAAGLQRATNGRSDVIVVINADASASHQSVINVMDAARRAGLSQLTFATQGQAEAGPAR